MILNHLAKRVFLLYVHISRNIRKHKENNELVKIMLVWFKQVIATIFSNLVYMLKSTVTHKIKDIQIIKHRFAIQKNLNL